MSLLVSTVKCCSMGGGGTGKGVVVVGGGVCPTTTTTTTTTMMTTSSPFTTLMWPIGGGGSVGVGSHLLLTLATSSTTPSSSSSPRIASPTVNASDGTVVVAFAQNLPPSPSSSSNHGGGGGRILATSASSPPSSTGSSTYVTPPPSGTSGDDDGGCVKISTSTSTRMSTKPPKLPGSKKRQYLEDMKGPLDHIKPKALAISTTRILCVQGGMLLTSFLGEQLESEVAREEEVAEGKLTPEEADREADEWEKREWQVRKDEFPRRVLTALIKFHASTLLMRLFEHVSLNLFSIRTVDRLTKDPFLSAQRKMDRVGGYEADAKDRVDVGRHMFKTCLYANAIAFLADYAVQQVILTWGYGVYYYRHNSPRLARQRRAAKDAAAKAAKSNRKNESGGAADGEEKECPADAVGGEGGGTSNTAEGGGGHGEGGNDAGRRGGGPSVVPVEGAAAADGGGLFLSFVFKSSTLMVSRTTAWVVSCAGASVGTMVYPGWGTVLGTQIGDGAVSALLDSSHH